VKPGEGSNYKGWAQLEGERAEFKELVFTSADGVATTLPLVSYTVAEQKAYRGSQHPSEDRPPSVAVDVDGTLCKNRTGQDFGPNLFGEPRLDMIAAVNRLHDRGILIIVSTVRGDTDSVKKWLADHSVKYDHLNRNPYQPPGASSKMFADVYIDDRAISALRSGKEVERMALCVLAAKDPPPSFNMGEAPDCSDIGTSVAETKTAGGSPDRLLDLPDIRQEDDYSCVAMCAMAICLKLGVGPKPDANTAEAWTRVKEEWKTALGTTEERSTPPDEVIAHLKSLGLEVDAQQNMTIDDLRSQWRQGHYVLCYIQEYGIPSKQASFKYGHAVVVIGVALGKVFVFDPSIDNALLRPGGSQGATEDPDSLQPLGETFIDEDVWDKVWHDKDVDGNKYIRFGISVAKAASQKPADEAPVKKELTLISCGYCGVVAKRLSSGNGWYCAKEPSCDWCQMDDSLSTTVSDTELVRSTSLQPVSPSAGYPALKTLAEASTPLFRQLLSVLDCESVDLPRVTPDTLREALSPPGPIVLYVPLKEEKRATEKVNDDYGGDWSQLTDMLRATVAADKERDLRAAIQELEASGAVYARPPKDRLSNPLPNGYRDFLANYTLPNGFVAEVQFQLKGPLVARQEDAANYHLRRSRRDLTDQERHDVERQGRGRADAEYRESEKSKR